MAIETTNELTELNAVNSILGAIGQTPVTTLDLENPETSFVYQLLQECNRDVQDEGWVFNREDHYPLQANAANQFVIPANVLRMDVSENDIYFTSNVVKRDGKLYDKYRHTFEFTKKTIYFDIVWLLPYSDLPSVFQRYITSKASGRAATQLVSNPALTQMLTAQEAQTRAACIEYECNQGDHNMMDFQPGTAYRSYRPYTALKRYA